MKTLKASVPEAIVAFLNIQSGDKLEWTMSKNERSVIVTKKKIW